MNTQEDKVVNEPDRDDWLEIYRGATVHLKGTESLDINDPLAHYTVVTEMRHKKYLRREFWRGFAQATLVWATPWALLLVTWLYS